MPGSPMKVTLRGFWGEERFCLCHCFKPRSTIPSSLVTQMLKVVEVSTLWLRVFIKSDISEKPNTLKNKKGGGRVQTIEQSRKIHE